MTVQELKDQLENHHANQKIVVRRSDGAYYADYEFTLAELYPDSLCIIAQRQVADIDKPKSGGG